MWGQHKPPDEAGKVQNIPSGSGSECSLTLLAPLHPDVGGDGKAFQNRTYLYLVVYWVGGALHSLLIPHPLGLTDESFGSPIWRTLPTLPILNFLQATFHNEGPRGPMKRLVILITR